MRILVVFDPMVEPRRERELNVREVPLRTPLVKHVQNKEFLGAEKNG